MNTGNQTEKAVALLRALINSLIDYPADLQIEATTIKDATGRDWRTNLSVTPNINDAGKVIGKQGAHFKALKRVMDMIGTVEGKSYVLRMEPGTGERRPEILHQSAGPEFNCDEHQELLEDVLGATGVDAEILVRMTPGGGIGYVFTVRPRTWVADEFLTGDAIDQRDPALITALAALFKAAGHRAGVVFQVEAWKL